MTHFHWNEQMVVPHGSMDPGCHSLHFILMSDEDCDDGDDNCSNIMKNHNVRLTWPGEAMMQA